MGEAPVSLQDYYNLLLWHDWFYMYSDDGRVYRKGEAEKARLEALAKQSPEHKALLEGFHKYHFSGKPWNTEQSPKPERPQ